MNNLNSADWVASIFIFLMLAAYPYFLGQYVMEVLVRFAFRKRQPDYCKWGVDRDLFWPNSRMWFIAWGILAVFITALIIVFAILSGVPQKVAAATGRDHNDLMIITGVFGFYMGFVLKANAVQGTRRQLERLDSLREIFHQRFPKSELLSMYESLNPAPKLFWDEYSRLPDEDVNEQSNQNFRVRAAPYVQKQSRRYTIYAVAATGFTLGLTAILVVIEVIRGVV